ncbi:MAG: hypothetical protein ACREV9_01600 [Burkholderiales bacterium]
MKSIVIALLLLSGAASAEEIALSRLDAGRKIVSPKAQVAEQEEAPRSRFPRVWYPIEKSPIPKERNEVTWAKDGYLFKYSF